MTKYNITKVIYYIGNLINKNRYFINHYSIIRGDVFLNNEQRAEALIKRFGFDFKSISKEEIVALIDKEIVDFQNGSSEYIRLLCGYLYCIGDISDVPLIEKAKYQINMDVGCMIDRDWIDSLKNGGIEDEYVESRENLINYFVSYYQDFKADDE